MARAPSESPRDPYLRWSVATGLDGFAERQRIPVLFERQAQPPGVDIRPWYPAQDAAAARRERGPLKFATGWLAAQPLLAAGDEALPRVQMSLPIAPGAAAGRATVGSRVRRGGARTLIGVIDRGCAYLNEAFGRRGKPHSTRLLAVWQQQASEVAAPREGWAPEEFGYGRVIDREMIERELAGLGAGAGEDPERVAREVAAYARIGYPTPWNLPGDDAGFGATSDDWRGYGALHGTFVLDTVGGLMHEGSAEGFAKPVKAVGEPDDEASGADLVFVDLPQPGPGDTTGASADAYILDAVHFILACAEAAGSERVVINLSVGANGGPHDGSGLLEQALDDLSLGHPELSIVAAAGNAQGESWSALGALKPRSTATLWWQTRPHDPTDSFLELWFSPAGKGDGACPLRVTLTAPDGRQRVVDPGQWQALEEDHAAPAAQGPRALTVDSPARPVAAVFNQTGTVLGQGPMALIALAPTQADARPSSAAGLWRVDLTNLADRAVEVNAWIQRDESGLDGMRRQSVIAYASPAFEIDGADTVTSLAMCASVTPAFAGTANAYLYRPADAADAVLASYCSRYGRGQRGAARREKRLSTALVERGDAQSGLWGTGAGSGTLVRLSGSSVAAPIVARQVVNDGAPSASAAQASAADHPRFGAFELLDAPGGRVA